MPVSRNCRRCRFRSQWNRRAFGWGTLMRHFLLFGPVTALALGVGMTTLPAGLIAATRGTDGGASGLMGTPCGAVAVTSVAVAANDHRGTATRTQIASSWNFHGQKPMGEDSNARFVKYLACSVARQGSGARQRIWLGRWYRCRAGISTGWDAFTALPASVLPPHPNRRPQPCRTAFARRHFAAQTARRKPCGPPVKTTINSAKRKNQNRYA